MQYLISDLLESRLKSLISSLSKRIFCKRTIADEINKFKIGVFKHWLFLSCRFSIAFLKYFAAISPRFCPFVITTALAVLPWLIRCACGGVMVAYMVDNLRDTGINLADRLRMHILWVGSNLYRSSPIRLETSFPILVDPLDMVPRMPECGTDPKRGPPGPRNSVPVRILPTPIGI